MSICFSKFNGLAKLPGHCFIWNHLERLLIAKK